MTGSYYFAARINSDDEDFIDFKLSGHAKGWVAVGFSATRAMVREREKGQGEEENRKRSELFQCFNVLPRLQSLQDYQCSLRNVVPQENSQILLLLLKHAMERAYSFKICYLLNFFIVIVCK